MRTIRELLDVGRDHEVAIVSEAGGSLTYRQLRQQIASLASQLAGAGIEAGDRVAIVLPNGPAMATTFLSIASCSTAAPLNPAYTEDEFRFYLDDLNAKTDAITEKIFGSMDQQTAATVARGKLRTLVGSEIIRELNLK